MPNSDQFYEEVGRRIRDERRNRKPSLTQQALAEMVSLTRTSITNVEKGRQKLLLHTLADIAAALQVEPSRLFPEPRVESKQLDKALRGEPEVVKAWVKSSIDAVEKGRSGNGS